MCREGNRHRGTGHRACTLGLARRGECLFATDTEQGRGDSGLPCHRPWRLPAPGAGSAQAAAAIGVPLTHTRCTGPCTAGLAVPGHSGHKHCPHGSCWWDLQHHLLEHSGCSKMLSWLRVQMQVPLVRSGQHSGQCWGSAGGSAGAAGRARGAVRAVGPVQRSVCWGCCGGQRSVLSALHVQAACRHRTHCSAPACSAGRAWAVCGQGGQCAGRVGSARAGCAGQCPGRAPRAGCAGSSPRHVQGQAASGQCPGSAEGNTGRLCAGRAVCLGSSGQSTGSVLCPLAVWAVCRQCSPWLWGRQGTAVREQCGVRWWGSAPLPAQPTRGTCRRRPSSRHPPWVPPAAGSPPAQLLVLLEPGAHGGSSVWGRAGSKGSTHGGWLPPTPWAPAALQALPAGVTSAG